MRRLFIRDDGKLFDNVQSPNALTQPPMTKHATRVDWNDIPLLLAIARERQLRAASGHLGVDSSTVSRRLAAAEERLQTRVFVRDPDGYKLTDAGSAFVAKAEEIESLVVSLFSITKISGEDVTGTVRITSVDALLNDWLTARLPSLLDQHPTLEVTLTADHRNLSFTRSETDIGLRLARPTEDAAIVMRRVGRLGFAVYGAPRFADVAQELWNDVPWITYNDDLADVSQMRWLRTVAPRAVSHFRSSSTPILLEACQAGLGLAVLPCVSAHGRKLVRLTPAPIHEREIWLLAHRDTANIRRFRVVSDWLAAQIAQDEALLAGI